MKVSANEIKPGMIIEYKGDYWNVLKTQHVKPGKGGAFNQLELKSVTKGTKLNERFRSNEDIQKPEVEERKFNFLYNDENNCHFMENKNFEQISISKNLLSDKVKLLSENMEVLVTLMEEKPINIELPKNLEFTIKFTESSIKGQTVASSYKPATLENDLNILVPPFLNAGDKIIIDTNTLEYVKKVS